MKKAKKMIAAAICVCAVAANVSAMNGEEIKINVLVNGNEIVFEDQQPVIVNDSTLLPVRGVMEAMGKQVLWEEDTQSVIVTDGTTSVKLKIDDNVMLQTIVDPYNNEGIISEVTLETPPMLINGRTCLPIRAIAEAFMAAVDWDADTQSVLIVTAELLC